MTVAKAVCDGEFRGDVEDLGGLSAERCLEQGHDRLLRMPGIFYHDSPPRIVQSSIGLTQRSVTGVRATRAPGPLHCQLRLRFPSRVTVSFRQRNDGVRQGRKHRLSQLRPPQRAILLPRRA